MPESQNYRVDEILHGWPSIIDRADMRIMDAITATTILYIYIAQSSSMMKIESN